MGINVQIAERGKPRQKPKSFLDFVNRMEEIAPRRKPVRLNLENVKGSLFSIRNKRIAIREAALRRVLVIITYTKITTGETKKYVVAPYSFKFRKLKSGRRKVLYAQDRYDERGKKEIKSFVVNNIKNVAITDRVFIPRWRIEIN